MPSWEQNAYYNPESLGLEIVHDYEAYGGSYEFSMLVVWREVATGKLFAAADSGCSCPTPFEDHTFPEDFIEVFSWEDVKALLDSEYPNTDSSYYSRLPHGNLRDAVKQAL